MPKHPNEEASIKEVNDMMLTSIVVETKRALAAVSDREEVNYNDD